MISRRLIVIPCARYSSLQKVPEDIVEPMDTMEPDLESSSSFLEESKCVKTKVVSR